MEYCKWFFCRFILLGKDCKFLYKKVWDKIKGDYLKDCFFKWWELVKGIDCKVVFFIFKCIYFGWVYKGFRFGIKGRGL